MKILVFNKKATSDEVTELLQWQNGLFIKVAVDIESGTLAAGGEWHADAEEVLLDAGGNSKSIWGGDWIPTSRLVEFVSQINIRPDLENRNMEIEDVSIRKRFEAIVRGVFDND